MQKVNDLFKANASNPLETAMLYGGRVGFVIPEYQRQYDWSEDNITRLYFDVLNGFRRLLGSTDANSFTFLGTLIFVKEETIEEEFSGVSVSIVDGQQRLTTLTLFACALTEALKRAKYEFHENKFSLSVDAKVMNWLDKETTDNLNTFYECAIGSQMVSPRETFPYPRIIRQGDIRGRNKSLSEYRSPLGIFLEGFAEYFDRNNTLEYIPPALGSGTDVKKLIYNYQHIRGLINNLNNHDWYDDTECEQFDVKSVLLAQYRNLFVNLSNYFRDVGTRNQTVAYLANNKEFFPLVRTILFSSYFCRCIVLTRVMTEDESAAFDIFDALNTTGTPLTALETLKPRVIHFENKFKGYKGSPSELAFDAIDYHLEQIFSNTSKKQIETKDLVVTFALYLKGEKLSKDLAAQRIFLRKGYDSTTKNGSDSARYFVNAIANTTMFRRYYWAPKGIEELSQFHNSETVDRVQLLMSLISAMKTSLALPILLRYWSPDLKHNGDELFVDILKAVTAFLVLRRAATGGTAGIDSDFRAIMAPGTGRGSIRKFKLCAGVDHTNPVLEPDKLKEALRLLLQHKFKTLSKESWVKMAAALPLYKHSRELVRFMILMAAHEAIPSDNIPGLWSKEGVRASANINNFLNYRTWRSTYYATVEHIAPETKPKYGWDIEGFYNDNILKHSLGNLILLPSKENSAIGNDSWDKKRIFYLALTEKSYQGQIKRIEEAKAAGINFSDQTFKLIQDGKQLSLLDPLRMVDTWSSEVVISRSNNIARLCWDQLWPWLN